MSPSAPARCILVIPALLVFGCGQSSIHTPDEKYFLVASNIKLPYWQAAANGLAAAAAQMKVKAEFVGPDTYDRNAELQEFRRVVGLKPAGILVSAADPELLRKDIDAAVASGIPVITMDSDAPGSARLVFVGTNNYLAGTIGGRTLAKHLNGKGRVVVFTIPGQANLEERLHGYKDALSQYPRIEIVDVVDIRGNPELAFDKTIELIESGKGNIDAFVCLEATAGKEVADVLDRKKIKDKVVVAMDTDEGTLDWIEKGGIVATIAQRPYTMAYYGLKVVDDLHHNRPQPLAQAWAQNPSAPIPTIIDTGATLIDRTNIAEIRKLNAAWAANRGR